MEDRPALKTRRPWLPVLVTLILIAVLGGWVGWQWQALEQGARNEEERRFTFEVDYIEHRLRERMQAYEMVLRGLAGLATASEDVRPDDWITATDQLDLQDIYPGIQAVSLARYVDGDEVDALVARARAQGQEGFRLYPAGVRDEHAVVVFTHPRNLRNRLVLGFDLLSEATRREAILQARNTGQPVLTGPLRLRQGIGDHAHPGVLLFLPFYATNRPVFNQEERRQAFLGVVYGAFVLNDLMAGILGTRAELFHLQIADAEEPRMTLLPAVGGEETGKAAYRQTRSLYLYGRVWQLTVASTPEYESSIDKGSRTFFSLWGGLLAAVLFACLVGGYLYLRERSLSESRALSLKLREREARFRLLIEKLPVATLLCDVEGRIELANQSAATLLAGEVEQMLGDRVDYYLPEIRIVEQEFMMPAGEEVCAQRGDGVSVPVTLSLTRLSLADEVHYVLNLVDLRAFKRVKERFRDMVEGLPNAFMLTASDGRIVMVNRQTELLFGYSRQELLGRSVDQLVPEAQREGHVQMREAYAEQPEPLNIGNSREVYGIHRDGHLVPLEIGLAPLRSDNELLVQAVLIDISHRKAAELRLRDQADQLATANRYKSEFLANMSHELRTPLNSILLLSDQMRQNGAGNLSDKQVQHADIIHRAGKELLQLINDVLDLSRIDAGRLPLTRVPLNLHELLQGVEDGLRPMALEKGLHLSTRIEAGTPQTLISDPGRLQQILRNLLSNALKFTEEGEVEIIARCQHAEADGTCRTLQLSVRDTGIGIAEAEQARIFQAFQQIDGSISRRYGGAGLGLSITRQLVEVLNGSIRVDSAPGQGACFTVELPLAAAPAPGPNERPLARAEANLLVVAADDDTARLVMEAGEAYGFVGLHCRSGAEAAQALRRMRFAAVVLDVQLPDLNGWQLYRQLRGDERHHDVPVLALSDTLTAQAWSDGALRHLSKPVNGAALQRLLAELARHDANPSRLLLVDPQADMRQRLRERFEALGYSVTLAGRSNEARLAFAGQPYSVVVVNFDQPDEDGLDLLEALHRLRPLNQEINVFLYSEQPLVEENRQRLTRYGGVALSREDVEERVASLLKPPSNEPLASGEAVGQPLLGRRVLLIDSDVRSIFELSALLDELGLQATPATDAGEALERFQASAFDLVLLGRPRDTDVAQLIRTLRDDYVCQVPIIALRTAGQETDPSTGADDYLAKPVQRGTLASLIEYWLGRSPGDEPGE